MPHGVIDDFEPVEINKEKRQLTLVAFGGLNGLIQQMVEHHAVGQLGQIIVCCQVLDLRLGALTFGHIAAFAQDG